MASRTTCRAAYAALGFVAALAGCADSNGSSGGADAKSLASKPANAAAAARSEAPERQAAIGSRDASDVTVRLVTPTEFKDVISERKGKVVLVDFWATYCEPCRKRFPQTLAIARKYAGAGLAVVSMSMDEPDAKTQAKVLRFLREQDARITNLANSLDETEKAFEALHIDGGALPHYKVFGRQGKLLAKFGGDTERPFSDGDIEAAVIAALKEK